MKQIRINEKCNQCGICAIKCADVFAENESGDIKLLVSSVEETDELINTIESCPVGAIELGDDIDKSEALKKYTDMLKSLSKGISVSESDVAFNDNLLRPLCVPGAGMSGYEYKSSSKAESAGYDAFVSRSYSQIDNVLLERITEYRITVVKPYYSSDESSVYYKYNTQISDVLKSIESIVGADKLPSDFCKVDIWPDSRDIIVKMLNKGEIISSEMASVAKSEFDYSASEYKVYIDYDDMEDYRGKDIYNYNAMEASEELARDLTGALKDAKNHIQENTFNIVKSIVEGYNKQLGELLNRKIEIIDKLK